MNLINLNRNGWQNLSLFDNKEIQIINNELTNFELRKATVVSGHENYRGDEIHWLDESTLVGNIVCKKLSNLMQELNNKFYVGLKTFEVHLAHYSVGKGYKKHFDSTKINNSRKISVVQYLNQHWKPEDKGQLQLHINDGSIININPYAGNGVIFSSMEIEHEVIPTNVDRWSIAAWFKN